MAHNDNDNDNDNDNGNDNNNNNNNSDATCKIQQHHTFQKCNWSGSVDQKKKGHRKTRSQTDILSSYHQTFTSSPNTNNTNTNTNTKSNTNDNAMVTTTTTTTLTKMMTNTTCQSQSQSQYKYSSQSRSQLKKADNVYFPMAIEKKQLDFASSSQPIMARIVKLSKPNANNDTLVHPQPPLQSQQSKASCDGKKASNMSSTSLSSSSSANVAADGSKKRKLLVIPDPVFPKKVPAECAQSRWKRKRLQVYKWEEIKKHNTKDSCWIVVDNLVMDVTNFLKYHPGKEQSIIRHAGEKCDQHFRMHSKNGQKLFYEFVIGRVEQEESACVVM